jgi:hypothetical protein
MMTNQKRREGRVAIAQDVINRIYADSIKIKTDNGYVVGIEDMQFNKRDESVISKEDCNLITKSCSVCALGSMLISRIDLFNSVSWIDLEYDPGFSDIKDSLEDYFDGRELALIETAFEKWDVNGFDLGLTFYEIEQAIDFGKKIKKSKDRLLAIMQNIVDHNGTFVPSVQYEVV